MRTTSYDLSSRNLYFLHNRLLSAADNDSSSHETGKKKIQLFHREMIHQISNNTIIDESMLKYRSEIPHNISRWFVLIVWLLVNDFSTIPKVNNQKEKTKSILRRKQKLLRNNILSLCPSSSSQLNKQIMFEHYKRIFFNSLLPRKHCLAFLLIHTMSSAILIYKSRDYRQRWVLSSFSFDTARNPIQMKTQRDSAKTISDTAKTCSSDQREI